MKNNTFTYNRSKDCYFFHDIGLSFQDANEHCKTIHNGRLVISDNNQTLNDLIDGYCKSNSNRAVYYRIGLKQQNGLLNWIDGSRFVNHRRIVFPVFATESCKSFAILFRNNQSPTELQFVAINCSYPLPYICEKSTNMESCPTKSVVDSISTPIATKPQLETTDVTTFATNFDVTDMTTFATRSIPSTQLTDLHSILLPCIAAVLLICGLIIFCAFLYKKHSIKLKSTRLPRVIVQHNRILFNDKLQLFRIGKAILLQNIVVATL